MLLTSTNHISFPHQHLVLLLLNGVFGLLLSQEIKSTVIIKDPAGKNVGPRITLSSTVLMTNEELEYTCIEGGDAEDNRLSRVLTDGSIEEFGSLDTKVCDYMVDPTFVCTIVTGKIPWQKEYGGRYCCSAFSNEWYYIHWIDPVLSVSADKDLDRNAYGTEQQFYCSVDMTPSDISYVNIFSVDWEFFGKQTRGVWRSVLTSDTVISSLAHTGANYTLTIKDFNPVKHGGEYRCQPTVTGYTGSFASEKFSVNSLPQATLINNKRNKKFVFGIEETGVKFTCEALSYPFPERIEFKLQSVVLDGNTPGVTEYEVDVLSTDVNAHKASFVVNNMTAVFQNDSVFECRVFRALGEKEAISQTRIILTNDTPPLETTTGLFMLQPTTEKLKNGKTKPWVIAIAVIIPIVIILIIVVLVVLKCRGEGESERGGNSHYYAPANDLSRTHNNHSRYSLHSQPSYAACKRDPAYASTKYSSEYAQSKIHQNPIYASRPANASCYGQAKASGLYDTPRHTGQSRPGTISREYRTSGEPPRAPPPGVPVLPPLPASASPFHRNGSGCGPLLAKSDMCDSHSEPEN
ncbi:uncharacterized protein [Watersipora subatra]|uniref:uncharacterized protein isoform X2 n=1 Tax=Watersipora subatra TaxID=2589382 RepID=UPI00355C58C0